MRPRAVIGLLALALAATAGLPAATASADPSYDPASRGSTAAAELALDQARAVIRGDAPHGREATPALRALARQLDALGPADRRSALRLLARPSAGSDDPAYQGAFGWSVPEETPRCSEQVCVHYVASTEDAASPVQVDATLAALDEVWAAEVGRLGYRAPKPDGEEGGDARLDVYLSQTGASGLYGYCTSDDPDLQTRYDVSSFCVLDNDFAEFDADPALSLRVTAAHEFFHTVQNAYDWTSDLWFAESTAAWVEDEVYDDANDNLQYLKVGPLGRPGYPLDYFNADDEDPYYYPQYGGWAFWKLLSETYGADAVRAVWTNADHAPGGRGMYSLPALRSALAAEGTTMTAFFARFGAVNRYPGRSYSEGRAYPAAPLAKTFTLTNRAPQQPAASTTLLHLSNVSVRYRAGSTLTGKRSLRVNLDMPPTVRGSAATVVVHFKDGRISRRPVSLDSTGAGRRTVPFSRATVAYVELTLTNASTRYDCDQAYPWFSCYGFSRDDGLKTVLSARAVRA